MAAKDQEIESLQERHHVELKVYAKQAPSPICCCYHSGLHQSAPIGLASRACLGLR